MASSPSFASIPRNEIASVSVANTARDGSGTIVDFVVAGANGTRIDDIFIKAQVTTTAGMIRFFIHNGTSYKLLMEQPIAAVTASTTAAAFEIPLYNLGIILKSGWKIGVATEKAEAFNISLTRGGDF